VPRPGERALLLRRESAPRSGDEPGHMDLLVIEVLAVMDGAVLAEGLAVVAREDHQTRPAPLRVEEGADTPGDAPILLDHRVLIRPVQSLHPAPADAVPERPERCARLVEEIRRV